MMNAMEAGQATASDMEGSGPQDVTFRLSEVDRVPVGQSFDVRVQIQVLRVRNACLSSFFFFFNCFDLERICRMSCGPSTWFSRPPPIITRARKMGR